MEKPKPKKRPRKAAIIAAAGLAAATAAGIGIFSNQKKSAPETSGLSEDAGQQLKIEELKKVIGELVVTKLAADAGAKEQPKEQAVIEQEPPEEKVITFENAADLARQGDHEAATWLIGQLRYLRMGKSPEDIAKLLNKFNVTEEEYFTLKRANDILQNYAMTMEPIDSPFSIYSTYPTYRFGVILELLQDQIRQGDGPFDPLCLTALDMNKNQYKDFVREVIAYHERYSEEDLAGIIEEVKINYEIQ